MAPLRMLPALALVAAASACTPVQWQNQTSGVAPSQAELGECNQAAYYEAQRQAFFYDSGWPYMSGWRRPYGPWSRYYTSNDRFFRERDLFDFCMRAKGYRLVPVPEPASNS